MSTFEIAAYAIAALILVFILRIFWKPAKTILWLFLNSAFGWGALMLFNSAFAGAGITIGVNVVTATVCGMLGIPGIVLIIILKFIFK